MDEPMTIQVSQRGVVVLPKALRTAYNLKPGDRLTLLDLGGAFVLSPEASQVDALADRISGAIAERGETLEGMLRLLREERERYADDTPGVS